MMPRQATIAGLALLAGGIAWLGLGERDACHLNSDIRDPYSDSWWTTTELQPLKDGLPVFVLDGVEHEHPVAMAQWGLRFLHEGDLEAATRIADALVEMSVLEGDARLYPYTFAWDFGGPLEPPWYSALAQAQVLSVLVRLDEAVQTDEYDAVTHETYRGLLRTTAEVDEGYWFIEYPVPDPNPVLNGHAFAALGVWDYWRWTDGEGDEVLCAAIETLARHIEEDPERAVFYDRNATINVTPDDVYREVHRFTFQGLGDISGLEVLADAADRVMADVTD